MGSAAFTSGSVDRTATVDVVGDDQAFTGLQAGDSVVVQQSDGGQLSIDFSQAANADGINGDANYTIGDKTGDFENETGSYAFNITNNDGSAHDYTLSYAFTGSQSSSSSVTFTVYDSTDTQIASASDSNDGSFSLAAGETAYVVMEVDSTGATESNDLDGDVTITAT
ncbi:hypothetical protein BRD03_07525 [Halobacteriales archaeon QS_9_68_17]|nr:MAG: hypothetical protein BRD03_07525 [Halobacteriales archaeon QS_9_68_17]